MSKRAHSLQDKIKIIEALKNESHSYPGDLTKHRDIENKGNITLLMLILPIEKEL